MSGAGEQSTRGSVCYLKFVCPINIGLDAPMHGCTRKPIDNTPSNRKGPNTKLRLSIISCIVAILIMICTRMTGTHKQCIYTLFIGTYLRCEMYYIIGI